MNMRDLERDLIRLRSAIEQNVQRTPRRFLERFPHQTCKTVSLLTARFLRESGWGQPQLVANGDRAENGQSVTHTPGCIWTDT